MFSKNRLVLVLFIFNYFLLSCSSSEPMVSRENRPTQGAEGIPGYIVRPSEIMVTTDKLEVFFEAPIGTLASSDGKPLCVSVWNTNMETLMKVAQGGVSEVNLDSGSSLGEGVASIDGSFRIRVPYTDTFNALVLFLPRERGSSKIPIPIRQELATAAYQTVADIGSNGVLKSVFDLGGFVPPPAALLIGEPSEAVRGVTKGVWISSSEIAKLPTSGEAWIDLKGSADEPIIAPPNLSEPTQTTHLKILAKALIYTRTTEERYRKEVIANVMAIMGTEAGGRVRDVASVLATYVIAADMVGLSKADRLKFTPWLKKVLDVPLEGGTLRSSHETWASRQGTFSGATRAAIASYLGDKAELDRVALVFKGYLGDRSAYSGFQYNEISWQSNAKTPVGINPAGANKEGISVDGVLTEDMGSVCKFKKNRRACERGNPPWLALQGAIVQAEILYRAGYDTFEWQNKALLRAVTFLDQNMKWEATGDDEWITWIVDARYGTKFAESISPVPGKNMGWTGWTHGIGRTK